MFLYISKTTETNLGARLHYQAIREIVGEQAVYTVLVAPVKKYCRADRYISYGNPGRIQKVCRWLQGNMMFISNQIIREICEIIKQYEIKTVFIEDSVFGNFVKKVKSAYPDIRIISFYHDIKANLYRQWKKTSGILGQIEYSIGIRQEKINQKYCDVNLVFNQRDADLFHRIYGKRPKGAIPLPASIPDLSEEYKKLTTNRTDKKVMLFVGKKYLPNIHGLEWFYKNVLPQLKGEFEVQIVGRGLEYLKDVLIDSHFNVIGEVESLDEYYENADIVIAPLFEGGGMKSKTVEAISFGKTFVGTTESLFGFWEEMDDTIKEKSVMQCDTIDAWVTILNRLIDSEINKFNPTLFELFQQKFSYEAMRDMLKEYIA